MKLNPSLAKEIQAIVDRQYLDRSPLTEINHDLAGMENYRRHLRRQLESLDPNSCQYCRDFLNYARFMRHLDELNKPDEADLVFRLNETRRLRQLLNHQKPE